MRLTKARDFTGPTVSNGSPIVAIRVWLQSQTAEVQHEIGLQVGYLLFDLESMTFAKRELCVTLLPNYLDDTISRRLQLGRMLSLKTCLDYMMRNRDSAEGWTKIGDRTRRLVEGDPDMEQSAEPMLASLPARQELWIKVAREWYALRDTIFEGDRLEGWMFREQ